HSKFVPDYYSVLVPAEQWTWFIFPWNLYEDLRNLISRALKVAHTIKDIKAVMRESFYIDVKASLIKEVLLDLEERGIARRRGNRWELAR
ncbi:MAG: phosphoribosyltransferase, partial [Thermoplasmata archaeon]|nr:phosphoribosyltransferase [Thermoplasmata archaeon]